MKLKPMINSVNWFGKIIEILVVVIGITLAFVVDRSNENYKNEKAANLYLTSLKDDLNADLEQLDSLLTILDNQQQLKKFVEYLPERKIVQDSLLYFVQALSNLSLFEIRQSSFKSLQGQVTLISNFQLRKKLFAYYHKAEGLQMFQQVVQNYLINLLCRFCWKN